MSLENVDEESLLEFVSETLDQLNSLEEQFVKLEKNPGDLEIINAIFRPFHSTKGSAAFFDLTAIKDIAHQIENLLDDLRKEKKEVTTEIITILLEGLDVLKERFNSLHEKNYQESLSSEETDYLGRLEQIAEVKTKKKDKTVFATEISKVISEFGEDFISRHPLVKKLIDLISMGGLQATHTEKEVYSENAIYQYNGHDLTEYISGFYQFISKAKSYPPAEEDYQAFSSVLENLLKLCQKEALEPLVPILDGLKENFDTIRNGAVELDELLISMLEDDVNKLLKTVEKVEPGEAGAQKVGEILIAEGKVTREDLDEAVSKQKKVGEILAEEGKISKEDLEEALAKQKDQIIKKPAGKEKKAVFKTMRVEENKIDHFMNFVGELIVSSEVFNYLQNKIEKTNQFPELAKEYKNANLAFNELSNSLQKSLMDIRKVPVKNLLQKMPRMVRDIAKNLDKNIHLEISGEDTKIDKSIIESIENPLIHIVRNASDHGVENKADRITAGKPEQANIKIKAYTDESFFYLDVIDDGKGIDPEKIKNAALKKGLISQNKYDSMSDSEAQRLIFLSGFSTAEKVTDVSGRGVGMDVAISSLKNANGSVHISSEVGKGSSIQMQVPLSVTLIVVDGLVVRVGGESFIIPIPKIKESLRPKSNEIVTVTKKGEMIKIREELFPLIRLHKLFKMTPEIESPLEAVVVLVENEHWSSCFLVDELVGQQQVVQKDLGEYLKGIEYIAGSAIMGDGRIGLILDVDGIMKKFEE